jgi:ABC-type branched-subunit amino acid transport system substrate-binding protein
MTLTEAEAYKTWATNKGTKALFAVITAQYETSIVTTVKKVDRGLSFSSTFTTPMNKPKAEAEDAFLQACKEVDRRMAKAVRK